MSTRPPSLAEGLLTLNAEMAPLLESAEGMKADMERRGWSPTAAEEVALAWLSGAMSYVWRSAK